MVFRDVCELDDFCGIFTEGRRVTASKSLLSLIQKDQNKNRRKGWISVTWVPGAPLAAGTKKCLLVMVSSRIDSHPLLSSEGYA